MTPEQLHQIDQARRYAEQDDYAITRMHIRNLLAIIEQQAASVPAYYVCKPGTADEQFVSPEAVNGFCADCVPLYAASPNESLDAKLGRIAMRFVDRAGDVDPDCDPAERICAEFYKAMSDAIPEVSQRLPKYELPQLLDGVTPENVHDEQWREL